MRKSILVVDPVSTRRIQLSAMLDDAHYGAVTAASLGDVPGPVSEFDLVVMGLPTDPPAASVAQMAQAIGHRESPLLCLDADPSPLRRLSALKAGAREVLARAVPDGLLLSRLRGLLREGDAVKECERRRMTALSFGFSEARTPFRPEAKIGGLCLESDLGERLAMALPLDVTLLTGREALEEARGGFDAYIVDATQGRADIDRLLPELRDRSHSQHTPVLIVYPSDMPDIATRALALGANDIVEERSTGEEFALRMDAMLRRKQLADVLRQSDEQSYRLAATDPLTGLYNRRYAEAYLGDLMLRSGEDGAGFVMMIVDLDRFKAVNDTYGHPAGDLVLKEVAHRLQGNLRANDLISRHGGEEFLIILPETEVSEGMQTAERLRNAIASRPVVLEDATALEVTASIGLTVADLGACGAIEHQRTGTGDQPVSTVHHSIGKVFEAADAALYRAKSSGRNRVELSDV